MPSLIDRLTARLSATDGPAPLLGDGDGDFGTLGTATTTRLTPAAVLVPIVQRSDPGLLLTRRTAALRQHAGQVAFPGGRIDAEDPTPEAAALREAQEEIGLPPHAVTLLGRSDPYETGTGYAITPIVGLIPPDLAFVPSASEVDSVFEIPLAFALDPANHQLREAEWKGRLRRFYVIEHGVWHIWGATAGMIVNLARRLA
ncbi:CoA pyrophosphatase [Sandaracinobacteroides saxicola]|uniref:CoA pyrophosphatase n=1 Tax=Sandaracinobacteroides saxicola TaxID=2759707 RepID=A0A7G5IDN6_9SPHN|nr:CoA pyrophosphatase [Sandaracinobacteroides saxicola]QMW21478.1 CoA pyrophosphatase [Sandaracinobacteroides saxicola]